MFGSSIFIDPTTVSWGDIITLFVVVVGLLLYSSWHDHKTGRNRPKDGGETSRTTARKGSDGDSGNTPK